ncbi:MAG: SO_0444 family Cu/Zn efflux transporter [Deltaproteobacteria bacterium]|nr:SO_0444 family Cu/Zn efflux transporter [Deltaproteobacteria bacterium]
MSIILFAWSALTASWAMLLDASFYILFGIAVGGLLKMFLSTNFIVRHLGRGRYSSVLKAALLGIPLPLCSCGVLPAAAAIKRQGANNGATTAFLISTPESGVDSISITYALLDPIMTVARPLAAFLSAMTAGVIENFFNPPAAGPEIQASRACPVDNCCDGNDCPDADHKNHHSFLAKVAAGIRYAVNDLWGDLAGWFFVGILLAGIISALLPNDVISAYLGGGLSSMLLMLVIGIPLYICATASTPIAAAFILKGMSPGTALVFLLAGPATNITSLSVLIGILGKRAAGIYLASISLVSVICGLALDMFYLKMGIKASAVAGQAADIIPWPLKLAAAVFLLAISIKPLWRIIGNMFAHKSGCGCSADSGQPPTPFPMAK